MTTIVAVLAAAALVIDSRLRSTLAAYIVLTGATLYMALTHVATVPQLAFFALIAVVKVVAGPAAVVLLARQYGLRGDLGPSINIAWRGAIVLAAAFVAFEVGSMPAFAAIPSSNVVLFSVFASIVTIVLHRNLLAHVIGLLALGSSISLAGVLFAPGLPGSIEVAGTFDAVIATLVAVVVARAIVAYDPRLDVRSLRDLRG